MIAQTIIVGTAVPTIIVLTAYYWKSRVPDAQISDVLLGYLSELPHNHTVIFGPDAQISDVILGYL